MLDIETLLILVATLTLFMAVMLAATYRKKNDRSAVYWIFGCLAIGAGLLLIAARAIVSDWLGYAVAVILVTGSNLLFGNSLRYLADRDAPRDRLGEVALGIFSLVYCVTQYLGLLEAQHFTALVAMAATALWAAFAARFAATRLKSKQLVVMQYLFIGSAVAWIVRLPAAYLFDFRIMNDPALVNSVILLASLAFGVLRHLLYLMVRISLAYEASLDRARTRQEHTRLQMLASLNALALARDNETGNHIMRTQHYARRIALRLRKLGHFKGELDERKVSLIFDADMDVFHGHLDIGMTGKLLGFRKRCPTSEQLGDVRVPTRGVEVGKTFSRLVSDTDPLQIPFDHDPRLFLFQAGK